MREGFNIGPLTVHYYGVIIMLGALLATWLAGQQAKRRGHNPEVVLDMLPWLLVAGIIGARLWHIFTPSASLVAQGYPMRYFTHPVEMLTIWNGGLGIPGAVIGGVLALWIYVRRHKLSFAQWVDFIAPGLALAQAVGRWGNFVNQELYGAPSNLPWAIFIEPAKRMPGFVDQAYYHPLFLYESIYNLLVMGFLFWLGRRFEGRLKDGDIFLTYLVAYPVGRFLLEFLRLDTSPVAGININQTFMAVTAVCAVIALVLRHRKAKPADAAAAGA